MNDTYPYLTSIEITSILGMSKDKIGASGNLMKEKAMIGVLGWRWERGDPWLLGTGAETTQ